MRRQDHFSSWLNNARKHFPSPTDEPLNTFSWFRTRPGETRISSILGIGGTKAQGIDTATRGDLEIDRVRPPSGPSPSQPVGLLGWTWIAFKVM
jgi:hypothetical protein